MLSTRVMATKKYTEKSVALTLTHAFFHVLSRTNGFSADILTEKISNLEKM